MRSWWRCRCASRSGRTGRRQASPPRRPATRECATDRRCGNPHLTCDGWHPRNPRGAAADAPYTGDPVFDALSEKLQETLADVRAHGTLTEDDINKAMREIRLA